MKNYLAVKAFLKIFAGVYAGLREQGSSFFPCPGILFLALWGRAREKLAEAKNAYFLTLQGGFGDGGKYGFNRCHSILRYLCGNEYTVYQYVSFHRQLFEWLK